MTAQLPKERLAFEEWYASRPLPGSDKNQQFNGWVKALEGKL